MTRTVLSTTLLAFVLAASLSGATRVRPAAGERRIRPHGARCRRRPRRVERDHSARPPRRGRGWPKTVYTDVDGRYVLELAPGTYQLKVADGRVSGKGLDPIEVTSAARVMNVDIGINDGEVQPRR